MLRKSLYALLAVLLASASVRRRRSQILQEGFGPEYDLTLHRAGSQSRAEAFQQCAAGNRLVRDDHESRDLLIWNGVLLTMPRISVDQR